MTSKLTRERLEKIKSWRETYGAGSNVMLPAEEAEELACLALAAMDSEPMAWLAIYHGEVYDEAIGITRSVVEAQADHFGWESALTEIIPLYRHAQPAPVVHGEVASAIEELKRTLVDCNRYNYCSDAVARVEVACRATMLQAGNHPAQSDCCPEQNSVNPAQGGNSLVIPDEMTSGQAYEIGYYYGDPVDVFARGANWMRQHIIDSTLAAAPQAAPVVPKEMTAGIAVKHWEGGRGSIESFIAGYNFCRAAILAAAPQEVKGE